MLKPSLNSGGTLRPIVYTSVMPEHVKLLLALLKLTYISWLQNWLAVLLSRAEKRWVMTDQGGLIQ